MTPNSFASNRPTLSVGGNTYTYGPLPALAQFHVLRRCGPVLSRIIPALMAIQAEVDKESRLKLLMENMEAFSEVLAKMPDAEANYVISECMKVCGQVIGDSVAPVALSTGQMMDMNMTMPAMIKLTIKVVDQHLKDFFSLLPGAPA